MSAARQTRSGSYDRPYRPAPIALVNAAGRALGKVGVGPGPLVVGDLMDAARKKTGLSDYGEEWFVPALEQLVRSVNEEARLNTVGQLITRGRLVGPKLQAGGQAGSAVSAHGAPSQEQPRE